MNEVEAFIDGVLMAMPELRLSFQEHIADNDEILPHVFMGDVTRFVLEMARSGNNQAVLQRFLSLVEDGLRSDHSAVKNLVEVSFLENLCGEDDAIVVLIPFMGETTRKELRGNF